MKTVKLFVRNMIIVITALVQTVFFPMAAYADGTATTTGGTGVDSTVSGTETAAPTTEEDTPPPATTAADDDTTPPADGGGGSTSPPATTSAVVKPPKVTHGPARPNGADGSTFIYNPASGYWENDYFVWNHVTKLRTPKQPEYRYNSAARSWEMTDWRYNPALKRYVAFAILIPQPPRSALITNTGAGSTNTIDSNGPLSGSSSIDGTGQGSNNSILLDSDGDGRIDFDLNASITNNLNSTATSGNASVLQNTTAGGALTGGATTIANILNMLQSSWNPGGDITTFESNIHGDVVGDIYIDPDQISNQRITSGQNPYDNLEINADINGQINNNITLDATSGNATVAANTKAGDATTGSANAMANVINLINSSIAAGDSFIGNINIHGSLDGDILLPSWLRNQLLASGGFGGNIAAIDTTGAGSTNTITTDNDSSLDADLNTNHVINNNIVTTANSGNALVSGNTKAGDAVSGDASTNINLFNMTGRQVIGENSLLVFVNVLGEWVGLIMDAPAGSTTAAVGSGITSNGALPLANNTDVNISTNTEINNNINVAATSGDATVENNTIAGSATTGDATASANVLNIAGSQFALSDWFGVLFINVFGSWHGSFGVDTAAGNAPTPSGSGNGGSSPKSKGAFDFRPTSTSNGSGDDDTRATLAVSSFSQGSSSGNLVADASGEDSSIQKTSSTSSDASGTSDVAANTTEAVVGNRSNWWPPIIFGGFLALLLLGGERLLAIRRNRSGE